MDVWVSSVAVYGILFGAVAIWWLVKRKQRAEVKKDWHFWTKQVGAYSFFYLGIGGWGGNSQVGGEGGLMNHKLRIGGGIGRGEERKLE